MKKLIFCVLMLAFAVSVVRAQRSEIGVFAGGSFYMGDLNPSGLFHQTQVAFGAVYRYNLTTRWALRGNVLLGSVQAGDPNPELNTLHFRSRINEFSVQAEINFLTFFTGSRNHRFTPYLFGGIGVFTFNPQALSSDGSRWEDLRPLGTEGQWLMPDPPLVPDVEPYSLTQITFPFGLGFKFSLSQRISLGVEWGMRKTLTNYLDDIGGFYVNPSILNAQMGHEAYVLSRRSLDGWTNPADAP
ncbi:MAG: porin family protein, partial [Bacteroidales bacterium]|nr:porin family protein [Bacteroidales bacterium]